MPREAAIRMAMDCRCGARIHVGVTPLEWQQPLWDHILDAHRGQEHAFALFIGPNGMSIDLGI